MISDKDCAELSVISAFAEIFPQAIQLLCQFQTLSAAEKRIKEAKLGDDETEEIFHRFKEAVYAKTTEELEDAAEYLTKLGWLNA